jgi:hypothetical protein
MKTNSQPRLTCVLYDLSILFLFSLRLRRSTRFACILAARSAYLSFSSFAARLSLIAWTFLCKTKDGQQIVRMHIQVKENPHAHMRKKQFYVL